MPGDLISGSDAITEIQSILDRLKPDDRALTLRELEALEPLIKAQAVVKYAVIQQEERWDQSSMRLPIFDYLTGCIFNEEDEVSNATSDLDGEIISVGCRGQLMYVETRADTEAFEREALCAKHAHEWLLLQLSMRGSSLPITIRGAEWRQTAEGHRVLAQVEPPAAAQSA